MKRAKICLLFTGGTIGMELSGDGKKTLAPSVRPLEMIGRLPELQKYLSLDVKVVCNIDSSNIHPKHWKEIASKVMELYDSYDGFVIAHGSDTVAYTASALSFALKNLSKPVMLTGSLFPFMEAGSDARNNLIHACLAATLNIAEVCVVFGHKIYRGNRVKKKQEAFSDMFHSPNYPLLGELGRPYRLYEWRKKRRKRKEEFKPEFDSNISVLKIFPGFDARIIQNVISRGAKGIIIEGFGPGNIPFQDTSLVDVISEAADNQIPVIIANQMEQGVTNLESYEPGKAALGAGAISSLDMTTEACVAKLMWALGQGYNFREVQKVFGVDLAGEVRLEES